jgi:hypothetical protein
MADEIQAGEVYQTRGVGRATVYWKVLTADRRTKQFQWFVRDDRGYDWCVDKNGKYWFSVEEHPLDLVELAPGLKVGGETLTNMRFHHHWKAAPESLASGKPRTRKGKA